MFKAWIVIGYDAIIHVNRRRVTGTYWQHCLMRRGLCKVEWHVICNHRKFRVLQLIGGWLNGCQRVFEDPLLDRD
eukprot:scaffold199143_cov52-Cyclotella_meneghiniana.AAC.1